MFRKQKTAILFAAALACQLGMAQQQQPPAILQVEFENWVLYVYDTFDPTKWATNAAVTPATLPKNFTLQFGVADIVAVNGQPAKGTMIREIHNMSISATPNPGQAIGDIPRGAVVNDYYEIQKPDGTHVGTIFLKALVTGPPPPGAPLAATQGNFTIIGGTGAFVGVRGQAGQAVIPGVTLLRQASITEDPANRKKNGGGGRLKWIMQLIPEERPTVIATANGPAITHVSDSTIVTPASPATPGETLSLFATGLGPTKPGVDPGSPFPAGTPAAANSPIAVTVNGEQAEVLSAAGYPGIVNGYQVMFRLPAGIPAGMASIQLSSAWIPGAAVRIPVSDAPPTTVTSGQSAAATVRGPVFP